MDPFIERLVNEQKELNSRLEKLIAFIGGEKFTSIAPVQQELLKIQASAMKTYSECLRVRLAYLNGEKATASSN